MTSIKDQLLGKWRITETSLWDRAYRDLVEPAFIAFAAAGDGEFRFGVVGASLACAYSQTDVGFEWEGSDEGTDVEGDGWAEPDGSEAITGESPSTMAMRPPSKPNGGHEAFFSSAPNP